MPLGYFVVMILLFTVGGKHWLKTPEKSFPIDGNRAEI